MIVASLDASELTADIVVVPSTTDVTSPSESTVATEASADVHVTGAPAMADPSASCTVATNCVVSVNATNVSAVGDSTTVAATCSTDTDALEDTPCVLAVIVAEPLSTAVTSPEALTVATLASEEDHVTSEPEISPPSALRTTPDSC